MLKISHISKTFNPGTVNEKKAIEDLSLELKQGDFATIIGSNGAGKSTLFNAICGDFLTDTGSVELDNKDITFMPQHARARSIGRLYHSHNSENVRNNTAINAPFTGTCVVRRKPPSVAPANTITLENRIMHPI